MNRLNIEQEQLIINLYKEGKSPYYMKANVEELKGFSRATLYNVLSRNGLTDSKPKLTQQQRLNRRKYNVNDNFFETIDTEYKAYWLGFIYADGYITNTEDKIGISLGIKDIEHLNKFKQHIEADNPIKIYTQTSAYRPGTEYCRLQVSSTKLKHDLIDKGVVVKKTFITQYPFDKVPQHLQHHFIRGYFDGDGSLTKWTNDKGNTYQIKICGTKEFLEGLLKQIGKQNARLYERFPERNTNNYYISIGGDKQVYDIMSYIYKDATIYLERKYERFIHLETILNKRLS